MPLSHLRVLELATILAGPAVGAFFAELGADVLKVENPRTGGDPTRGWRLAYEDTPSGQCAYFCSVNWGKRSVALDIAAAEGRRDLKKLLADTDLLIVNFKPGDDQKLGLSLPALLDEFPRLIIGWITGYGADSPRAGFDVLIQAESGFMAMNGPAGGPPCRLPVAVVDLLTAHQLKEALLVALLQRERDGRGRLVEASLWKTAVSSLANQGLNVLMAGFDPRPEGTEHPNLFPYGTLLPCRDAEVLVAVGTDRQFEALCAVLGVENRFPSNASRTQNREALRPLLEERATMFSCQSLLDELHARSVPAGQLCSIRQALATPASQDLLLRDGLLAGIRSVAFRGVGEPRRLRPPPRLGEHNGEGFRS